MNSQTILWLSTIKCIKDACVKSTERGDLSPTLLVERDGKLICIVGSPQVDKILGLRAAEICRIGMGADAIVLVNDAHYAHAIEGESQEEFKKRFPPGSMQKMCDEEGACERGIITDCLTVLRCDAAGNIVGYNLPYSYHGKGTEFKWLEEVDMKGATITGFIPEAMRKIMAKDSHVLLGFAATFGLTLDEAKIHSFNGTVQALMAMDYTVLQITE